jgi:polar amino acid transport system ATP-binding protein
MLKIENLMKSFGTRKILDDVSLNVGKGEIAILLGQSGVGKSTLLRVLNNLEKLDSGTLSLDGKKLDLDTIAKSHTVGMVFQQFNLFDHLTVEENITLALEKVVGKSKEEAHAIAMALLKRYGLEDKAPMYVSQLSGGQKQRLAIARTLALKPKVVCLDEPTSALDPLLTSYVAQNIQQLANDGYIVLVASHDVALLDKLKCTIYLMQSGKIVESAGSEEFKNHKEKYPILAKFVAGAIE